MIPRMDSQSLNKVLNKSLETITEIQDRTSKIKNDIEARHRVIQCQQAYNNYLLQTMIEGGHGYEENKALFYLDNPVGGLYSQYGLSVVPRSSRTLDLFNVKAIVDEGDSSIEKVFFRNLATLELVGEQNISLGQDVFKDPRSEDKGVFFLDGAPEEFVLSLQSTDEQCFSQEEFNTIEINPYLPGTFDIDQVLIQERSKDELSDAGFSVQQVPKCKIPLDRKYRFYRLDISLKSRSKEVLQDLDDLPEGQVFGLKKLGLLREDYTESYIIAEIRKSRSIQDVKEDITLYTIYGGRQTTASAEGIELFLGYTDDGYLYNQVEPSRAHERQSYPVRSEQLYARIPVSSSEPLLGVKFHNIVTR